MVVQTDFKVDATIKDALIKAKGEAMKYEPGFMEKYPVVHKIKARVIKLKAEKELLEQQIEEKPMKFRLEKLQKINEDIQFYFELLDLLGKQQEFIQNSFESFSVAVNAYIKGDELLKTFGFLQEWAEMEYENSVFLTEFNIQLLDEIKKIKSTGELPDTEKIKTFYSKLREKAVKLNKLITEKINESVQ